jgi:ribosomal protein S1
MQKKVSRGKITSINHEKNYASIEYIHNDKKRTITCRIDEDETKPQTGKDRNKHTYRVGDEVSFQTKGADRGSRLIAFDLKFLYNNTLLKLLQKAAVDNRFTGYLKKVDDAFFVKERESYLFFPLEISKWENIPQEDTFNEPIEFSLLHIDKPDKIKAELFTHQYIPAFKKAVQHFKNKTPVDAIVYKVSPFAVYVHLFEEVMQAKIALPAAGVENVNVGDAMQVKITYLNNKRLVVESV